MRMQEIKPRVSNPVIKLKSVSVHH